MSERVTPPMGKAAIMDAHAALIAAHAEHDKSHVTQAEQHYIEHDKSRPATLDTEGR